MNMMTIGSDLEDVELNGKWLSNGSQEKTRIEPRRIKTPS